MTRSCLPAWPVIIFGVIEPLALIWAYVLTMTTTEKYFADQVPSYPMATIHYTPQAKLLTLQTGNVFLLLAALAIICCWTKHRDVAVWYLIAVAFADVGHIAAVYFTLGSEQFFDFASYNDMLWGSVGVSAFLNINRWLTVLGVFGRVGGSETKDEKNA